MVRTVYWKANGLVTELATSCTQRVCSNLEVDFLCLSVRVDRMEHGRELFVNRIKT